MSDQELCACGQPLHYTNPQQQMIVSRMVRTLGPTVRVHVSGLLGYDVPRHYIALHGIKAEELPELAARYGWTKGPKRH